MRQTALLLSLILLAAAALPARASEASGASPNAAYDSLVAAEVAFAKLCGEKGMKDSFLANVADDGILFRPGPVAGKEWLTSHPAPAVKLEWGPEWAFISRSGELGFTTGPFHATWDGGEAYGHFATVWLRGKDGAWKFVVDGGTNQPDPLKIISDAGPARMAATPPSRPVGAKSEEPATLKAALLALDRGLATGAATYAAAFATDAHLLRDGHAPYLGQDAIRTALASEKGLTWDLTGSGLSAAADLAYTFGTAERHETKEKGAYMRFWERQPAGDWKILLDVVKLAPPPKAE